MLSSHLPRTLCDKFVYDFPCGFWGIVGGYGLRRMCSHCLRASRDFLYGPSGAGRGKSAQRLRGDCMYIMQSQCSCMQSQPPHGNRMEPVQLLRGDGVVIMQPPCCFLACGLRAVPVRGLCNATYILATTCLRATD